MRKVRYNTMSRLKSDVEYYMEKYHVNTITVWDDNFFAQKDMAIESGSDKVLQQIIHKPLRVNMLPGAIDIIKSIGIFVVSILNGRKFFDSLNSWG